MERCYCQIALQQTISMPLLTVYAVMVALCMRDIVLLGFYYFLLLLYFVYDCIIYK